MTLSRAEPESWRALHDASEQSEAQPQLCVDFRQTQPGERVAQVRTRQFGRYTLFEERQHAQVLKQGVTPKGVGTFSFVARGPMLGQATCDFEGRPSTADDDIVYLLPDGIDYNLLVDAGVHTAYITIAVDEMLADLRTLDPERWEQQPDTLLALRVPGSANLPTVFDEIADTHSTHSPAFQQRMVHNLMVNALHASDAATRGRFRRKALPARRPLPIDLVRHATDLIDASLHDGRVISVLELCRALNVAERSLRHHFMAYLGMPPKRYLLVSVLNAVRADLLKPKRPDATVTRIVFEHGGWHMGRFSAAYRQFFGELPSATLRRGLRASVA